MALCDDLQVFDDHFNQPGFNEVVLAVLGENVLQHKVANTSFDHFFELCTVYELFNYLVLNIHWGVFDEVFNYVGRELVDAEFDVVLTEFEVKGLADFKRVSVDNFRNNKITVFVLDVDKQL